MKLLLASSSTYRRTLLSRIVSDFEFLAPEIDETRHASESPRTMVLRLARAKATVGLAQSEADIVIASDQTAVIDGRCLGKPGSVEVAKAQLAEASGRCVRFLTSVVVSARNGYLAADVVACDAWFRPLSTAEISDYVAAEAPLDCAGSFKCEGLGIVLLQRLSTDDPTALIGLPLIALSRMLNEAGYPLIRAWRGAG
ncbi:MAG: nucleoside triphosphate pyrophosphatase [Pseudomonadota bacterium]